MSSICKYCSKTEIYFDNAYKSKSGKMIPLDKQSGLPHNCSESPYAQQQQPAATTAATATEDSSNTNALLKIIIAKLQRLIKLIEEEKHKEDNIPRDGSLLNNR